MEMVAVITGASGGIGSALVQAFASKGYSVLGVDKVIPMVKHPRVISLEADLSTTAGVDSVINTVKDRWGYAHVLINNAAIAHFSKPLQTVSPEEMSKMLDTNVLSAIKLSQGFIGLNQGQAFGRIINIASTRYHQNEANWELYGSTKGALVSFTSSLAVSLSQAPITVNAISPGWIHCQDEALLRPEDHVQHPSGRVGRPEDIVKACFYLADPDNDFVNGINLIVDGGMSKKMIYLE